MADLVPVLIPAIAAIVGITITGLVTYAVAQERMPQRLERLASTRKDLSDNLLLIELIDKQIRSELLLSLRTRFTKFLVLTSGLLTVLSLLLFLGIGLIMNSDPTLVDDSDLVIISTLFGVTVFLFTISMGSHLWVRMHLAADRSSFWFRTMKGLENE